MHEVISWMTKYGFTIDRFRWTNRVSERHFRLDKKLLLVVYMLNSGIPRDH